jgi:hypothetical protein
MGSGAMATCVRAVGYGGDAVGGSAQVGFARPVSVWRVATLDWERTSVQGLATSVHNGVPASVPGRSAARPSARRRARARTDAVQIRVALFKRDFLQFFQLMWYKD